MSMRGFSLIEMMVVVAVTGILATLGTTNYQKTVCRAQKTEAFRAMSAVAALQEGARAERDSYVTFASTCAANVSGRTCFVYSAKGKTKFSVIAEVTPTGYLVTATGRAGTQQGGAIWRMDQTRNIRDVTGLCK